MSSDNPKKRLLSIGQFSEITRLSVKALRLYDSRKLLVPAYVDDSTGYRYYRLSQSGHARLIKILRSVDMPLERIRSLLLSQEGDARLEQLLLHKSYLEDLLAGHSRMLTHLESIIQVEEDSMSLEVNVSDTSPLAIAGVRFTTDLQNIKQDIAEGFGKLGKLIAEGSLIPNGVPMMVYHDVIDEESGGDVEICVPVGVAFNAIDDVFSKELEGGLIASTIHKGPHENIGHLYQKLPAWIYDNGYEISGPPREVYENDPRNVAQEELLTRVEFPVKRLEK